MPNFCAVVNCGNRAERDKKSYFRLPAVPTKGTADKIRLCQERQTKWLVSLHRDDITENMKKGMRICEDHFLSGKPADLYDTENPDWFPSKNMGYDSNTSMTAIGRYQRSQKRKKLKELSLSSSIDEENEGSLISTLDSTTNEVCSQTELSMQDINDWMKVQNQYVVEICELQNKLNKQIMNEESFSKDDDKTLYYTGLKDFKTLMISYKIVEPFLSQTPSSALNKFQQFILTLMRLRLNLDFKDLGYRFSICRTTASRIFHACLYVMYMRLGRFVFWPDHITMRSNLPEVFAQTFNGEISVIIDCFEVFIEKPSNLLAAAQTWSNYKHHHTIKFFIGISAHGTVIFISSAWGGRTSDKHIVLNSGILDKLLPGDIILADRGFTIQDEVNLYCAEIKVPAFTKGKKQLSAFDIEKTRKIAHARIHVERVIGLLKQKYRILEDVMPIATISKSSPHIPAVVDQIVTVCCALINLSPSVIPY